MFCHLTLHSHLLEVTQALGSASDVRGGGGGNLVMVLVLVEYGGGFLVRVRKSCVVSIPCDILVGVLILTLQNGGAYYTWILMFRSLIRRKSSFI